MGKNAHLLKTTNKPAYYKGEFTLEKAEDTFLDFSTWGKGFVWVNGHALGRIWEIGPQQTLYMPGCWLKSGKNEIIVLDILGAKEPKVQGLDKPILHYRSLSAACTSLLQTQS